MIKLFTEEEFIQAKCRELFNLKCKQCEKIFQQPKNQILAALNGKKKRPMDFCSPKCGVHFKNKDNYKIINCKYCTQQTRRRISQISPNGNVFCSRSCSASFNNDGIRRNNQEKKLRFCSKCNCQITAKWKYCPDCRPKRIKKVLKKDSVIAYMKRSKIKAIDYKGGKCIGCGYNKSVRALQFHHIDEKEKSFNISGRSIKWERLAKELDKCILVCANCHAEIHDGILNANLLNKEDSDSTRT